MASLARGAALLQRAGNRARHGSRGSLLCRAEAGVQIREYPDPGFIAETLEAFPDKAIANAEEARVRLLLADEQNGPGCSVGEVGGRWVSGCVGEGCWGRPLGWMVGWLAGWLAGSFLYLMITCQVHGANRTHETVGWWVEDRGGAVR